MDDQTLVIIRSIALFMKNADDMEIMEIFDNMPYEKMRAIFQLLYYKCS